MRSSSRTTIANQAPQRYIRDRRYRFYLRRLKCGISPLMTSQALAIATRSGTCSPTHFGLMSSRGRHAQPYRLSFHAGRVIGPPNMLLVLKAQ
jgi:hypothetical protein